MRIEVRCPSCNKGYLLDQTSLGGEFICPACLSRIDLSQAENHVPLPNFFEPTRSLPVSPDMENAPLETDAPAAPAVAPSAAATAGAATPAAVAPAAAATVPPPAASAVEREQVICPRCNLHFAPRRGSAAIDPGKRPTVLVIEDMGYFRQIAKDALADEYEVRLAGSTDEAKRLLGEGGVDLIVLDLTLDGNDSGLQLLRETRLKACPILIYTARDESEMYGEEWEELQKLGADDIVIKGMNVAESLRRKVAALLGRHWDGEDDID
jgi:CheY-like chemotaxis protein